MSNCKTLSAYPVDLSNKRYKRILLHVKRAVEQAKVCSYPFAHVYMTNVFPDDVYAQIQKKFPNVGHYHPLNIKAWSRANGESTRDRLILTKSNIEQFSSDMRGLWNDVVAAIIADELKTVVFRKLASDIAHRFNMNISEIPDLDAYPRAVLYRDTDEYRIKPHPDGVDRIVTMQYYLPADDSQKDLGTSFYTKQATWRRLFGERFKEVKRLDFMPNTAYAFVVNRRRGHTSWHGREYIEPGRGERNTILTQFRTSPGEFDIVERTEAEAPAQN